MKPGTAARLAVLLLAAAPAFADGGGAPADLFAAQAGAVRFLRGREAGLRESAFSGKPVMFLLTTRGSAGGRRLGESVFRDPRVVDLADRFVPCLVDGGEDREFAPKYGSEGYPSTVFVGRRGEAWARIEGAVGPEDFLDVMRRVLDREGPARPSRAAREFARAAADLAKAREKKEWRVAVRALLAVEKAGREGPEMEAARAARKDAEAEAKARLDAAKKLIDDGKDDPARAALRRIASDFEGLPAAVDAKALLELLDAKGDGGDGGSGEGYKGKHSPDVSPSPDRPRGR